MQRIPQSDPIDAPETAGSRPRRGLAVVGAAAAAVAAALGVVAWSRASAASADVADVVGFTAVDTDADADADCKATACSPTGVDPWVTGQHLPCCPGLQECLHQWENPTSGRWFWRCYHPSSPQAQIANEKKDPTPRNPKKYYPHFDTTPDYLDIASQAKGLNGEAGEKPSDNYYLVIGDQGGCSGGCNWGCCDRQLKVAKLMQDYVAQRKKDNPNSKLLFVMAVGDNFYWNGAAPGRFKETWFDVYGAELTSAPWFAIMGNHDFGNADPGSACPFVTPRFECTPQMAHIPACGGAKPYSRQYQAYDSNALNPEKGGVDGDVEHRQNWQAPDYTYYYSIPKLNFEIVALDWNVADFHGLGGDGPQKSASELTAHCGSEEIFEEAMNAIKDASTKIMAERSMKSEYKNVAIIGHYPFWCQGGVEFRDKYIEMIPAAKKNKTKVFNFFGHTHIQQCYTEENGECVNFLTGGGGGCCGDGDTPAGFTAISWDTSLTQVVECFVPDARCNLDKLSEGRGSAVGSDVCKHTIDDPSCPLYDGPKIYHNVSIVAI